MKLKAETAGEKHELMIKREGARLSVSINGRCYQVEARETTRGAYLLLFENRVYECLVDQDVARRDSMRVYLGSRIFSVSLMDPKRLRGSSVSDAETDRTAQIIAPMPGKVVRVLVQPGAEVEAGDGVVVVEAMKMQNELKSPKTGRVTELHARMHETVNAGDVLAVIE
ncbi:MAG TPA: biotin/lipoyl-containing protein [Pyrinomonadaceae bacterium]|jgi:biotin carboxyl carrier protein